jgi:hypothetical protein
MKRTDLVMRLVASTITREERRRLGPSVKRAEVCAAIATLLERHGRFPLDDGPQSGLQLVVVADGVRIVDVRRPLRERAGVMASDAAIDLYVLREFGPIGNGITIRP